MKHLGLTINHDGVQVHAMPGEASEAKNVPNIGVLYGGENSFPNALIERIKSRNIPGITAEAIRLGGVKAAVGSGYGVIIDRISEDVDFYRAFLKNAVLNGAWVLNNPFRWTADDKLVHCTLAKKIGLSVPNTVALPQKSHPRGTSVNTLRNLAFPLNWDEAFEHVGFPAYLKPVCRGGWMTVQRVNSREDFFAAYDNSGDVCMLLQTAVPVDKLYRCYVVGQGVKVLHFDPNQPQHLRYSANGSSPAELHDQLAEDALTLCRALGYDINAVDFAVHDGSSFIIDSYNLAPDADVHSVGQSNFDWIVDNVATLAIDRAQNPEGASMQLVNGNISGKRATASV